MNKTKRDIKMEKLYIEALNSRSIESYEAYLEELKAQGEIAREDLRKIESLPLHTEFACYALAILA